MNITFKSSKTLCFLPSPVTSPNCFQLFPTVSNCFPVKLVKKNGFVIIHHFMFKKNVLNILWLLLTSRLFSIAWTTMKWYWTYWTDTSLYEWSGLCLYAITHLCTCDILILNQTTHSLRLWQSLMVFSSADNLGFKFCSLTLPILNPKS